MSDVIRDGAQAAVELEQTEKAFNAIREATINRLLNTGAGESDVRDKLVSTVQALDLVRDALRKIVQDGKDAKTLEDYTEELAQKI